MGVGGEVEGNLWASSEGRKYHRWGGCNKQERKVCPCRRGAGGSRNREEGGVGLSLGGPIKVMMVCTKATPARLRVGLGDGVRRCNERVIDTHIYAHARTYIQRNLGDPLGTQVPEWSYKGRTQGSEVWGIGLGGGVARFRKKRAFLWEREVGVRGSAASRLSGCAVWSGREEEGQSLAVKD